MEHLYLLRGYDSVTFINCMGLVHIILLAAAAAAAPSPPPPPPPPTAAAAAAPSPPPPPPTAAAATTTTKRDFRNYVCTRKPITCTSITRLTPPK